ncbi:MAG: alpha-2-macroglobulin, partial [Winogradskyella sp.]|nr:alpha-2-macroglobulin [Winogradskyella sp.]
YIVHAQTKEDDVFATAVMQATNLALVESNEDKKDSFQVIDRSNGQPKIGAIVEMKYKKNSQDRVYTKSFTTDRFGKIYFNKDRSTYRNIYFKIKHNDEEGYFGQYYINRDYNNKPNNDVNFRSFVFTDRSIYRPGQIVYYKGIITKSINDKTTVAPGMEINVALHNVNGEKLSSLQLETNEFGSIKGEFILPNDGLTGQYYIRLQSKDLGYDNTFFSVEEYKRPKFEANFKPVTQLFRVNDTVRVNGEAMAYAGSAITDAKVVYKVSRSVNYPSWYYWRRPYYTATTQEIVHGETQTNGKGEFSIDFKAIPDSKADKNNLPIFNYEITADITDINGETRTAVSTVQVGYHSMTANIMIDGNINKAKKSKEITIDTRNLNGEFVGASGNLKIYKLIPPKKPLRPRPWLAPDYQQISEGSFNSMFPNEPYNNEEQLQNWKLGKIVYETSFNTSTSKIITLEKIKKWESGKYIVELQSEDKFGQSVKAKTYTTVYDFDDKQIADNQLFTIETNKNSYQPNDKATVTFASAAKITITVDIEKEGQIVNTYLVQLNNSKSEIELDISESDLGGFVIHYSYAAFNYFQSRSRLISVPYPKTDLAIETTTFRDKLLPGQNETWSFKIKGPKGEKVAAELLASMYDASLDQFKPHNWYFNPQPDLTYYEDIYKNGSNSFGTVDFRMFNRFQRSPNYIHTVYEQFNWFGFYFGRSNMVMLRGAATINDLEESAELDEVVVTGYAASPEAADEEPMAKSIEEEVPFASTSKDKTSTTKTADVQIRTNLQETAFFFPQLQTDAEGNVSFNFVAPEALTQWKLQLLAHTKDLEHGVKQFETVTQKE